ncbi:hypothetical protein [Tunturiibacter gelidoferens]|uniref:Uncharacterized protein n=1 Tax=Tunturiibacter gelidiferens TaxID=3069689 RepID=A0ACC5NZI8_9BACT|nr:hypothetical protein [Edaphobacter lichenicola]MBB5339801.1 hypothetical protein [Edaphobacter lichenicola]
MVEEIFDVVLQSTGGFVAENRDWQESPPPEGDFRLGADLWIGRLPLNIQGETVFDACEPAGFNFNPARQYGYRYAFCRKVEPCSNDYYSWDSDVVLGKVLFLSRLIHPTTVGTHYSARLYFRDGNLKTIVPGHTQGYGTHAWIVASHWRDWLCVSETETLRDSLPKYILNAPNRVRRARKHIDHSFHSFYLDQRVASLVTSFESLLKVSQYQATSQFKSRAPRLAQMVGLNITDGEAQTLYCDRSAFVHGDETSFAELSDELIEQYNRFERVLRLSLLQASTDEDFSKLFAADDSVIQAFGRI